MTLTLTFELKDIGCNSPMLGVELQRREDFLPFPELLSLGGLLEPPRQEELIVASASDRTGQVVLAPSFTVRRARILRDNLKSRLDVYNSSST